MINTLALQHNKKLYMKCTKHTHYHLHGKTVQYISVNTRKATSSGYKRGMI